MCSFEVFFSSLMWIKCWIIVVHFSTYLNQCKHIENSHSRTRVEYYFHTCLPVTTAQWSKPVDSCVCCRSASWLGWAGHSESQPGRLRWSDWFSGHTGLASSAPLLRSSGCTPPIRLQTSWDNTTEPAESTSTSTQSLIQTGLREFTNDNIISVQW